MHIPIVKNGSKIVGWTAAAPEYRGGMLCHSEAERLLGGSVDCTYIQIDNPPDAERAGAPHGWSGPWRCLAICRIHAEVQGGTRPRSRPAHLR